MGGWQSASPNPDTKDEGFHDVMRVRNNNRDEIVIIPVDFSKHAEDAFECGYSSFYHLFATDAICTFIFNLYFFLRRTALFYKLL